MKATLETPAQMLERLDRMGLERVKALVESGHFEAKTIGLVTGWIKRKEEERFPTTPEPSAEEVAREALKTARQAQAEARKARHAAASARRASTIALVVAGAAAVIAVLGLFAAAIR